MSDQQQAEIWFEHWHWSYMPCHWKGWGILLGAVLLIGVLNVLIVPAVLPLGDGKRDLVFFISMGLILGLLEVISRKHSLPK